MANVIELKLEVDDRGSVKIQKFASDAKAALTGVEEHSKKAGGGIDSLKNSWALMSAGIASSIYIFNQLKQTIEDLTRDYVEQEQANIRFGLAMKNAGTFTMEGYRAFKEFAEQMQKTTGIQDDYILKMGALLATTGLHGNELQRATRIAADYAKLMDKDMSTVIEALTKYNLGLVDSLNRVGIETKGARGESLTFNQVLDEMEKKSRGVATVLGDTLGGQMEKAKGWWSNLKEALVGAFIDGGTKVEDQIDDLSIITSKFNDIVQKQAEVVLPRDEEILNRIAVATKGVAKETDAARKAREELQKILERQAEAFTDSWGKMVDAEQEMLDKMAVEEAEKAKKSIQIEKESADKFAEFWGQRLEEEKEVLHEMLREEAKKKIESERLYQDQVEQLIINQGIAFDNEMDLLNEAERIKGRKRMEEIREEEKHYRDKILMSNNFWAGVKLAYQESLEIQYTWAKQGAQIWADVFGPSGAIESTLHGFFYDAFRRELKTAEDYFKAFTDAVLEMFARMLAQMVAQWAASKIGSFFGLGSGGNGGGFSLFGGGGGGGGIGGGLGNNLVNSLLSTGASAAGNYLGISSLSGAGAQLGSLWSTGSLLNLGGDVTATGIGAGLGSGGAGASSAATGAAAGAGTAMAAAGAIYAGVAAGIMYGQKNWTGTGRAINPFYDYGGIPGFAAYINPWGEDATGYDWSKYPNVEYYRQKFQRETGYAAPTTSYIDANNEDYEFYKNWMTSQPEIYNGSSDFWAWLNSKNRGPVNLSNLTGGGDIAQAVFSTPANIEGMALGGVISEPSIVIGRSGRVRQAGERGREYVVPEGSGGGITIIIEGNLIGTEDSINKLVSEIDYRIQKLNRWQSA